MFLFIGIIGLILVSLGLLVKSRKLRDTLSFLGGACLLVYSIYKKDTIFIILQSFYVFITIFDYLRQK